jgi:hypothetical protein
MRPTAHLIWFFVLLGISFDSVSARQSEMGAEGMSQANSSLQAGVKPGSVKGVVWEIPDDFQEAAEDLLEMQLMGISAVRTGLVFDQGLIRMADSLGLVLYRELPLHGLGPRSLTDSLSRADSLLLALVEQGKGYSSAGPIGLVRNSDTSSPAVCPELQRLTNILHQTGNQAYYVTNFIESDACSDAVDFVLIDALDHEHPEQLLERWKKAHQTPVGLARIGTSATPGSEPGSLIKGSPQYQARFLENVFAGLQSVQSVGMFVHRWKDESRTVQQLPDPYRRNYGLYNRAKDPRPALYVTRGVYLGIQNTFVFERGKPEERPLHWFTLVGWILLSMMAVIYAGSPRFRSIIPRYFFAHGFYRNAVREAREVLPLTSTALLTIMGLSIGLIATHVIISLQETRPMLHLFSLMDQGPRTSLTLVLEAPFVLAILMGSMALLSMSIWMGMWMMASGRRSPLYPSQALMLAVWPRWQVLFILPIAMTFESTPGVPLWAIVLLAVIWIGCAYWATLRTAYDLFKVARIVPGTALLIWLLNPLILGTMVLSAWSLFHWDEVTFLWHLATRL